MSMRERIKSSLAHASGSVRCHFGTFETARRCSAYSSFLPHPSHKSSFSLAPPPAVGRMIRERNLGGFELV